MYGCSPPIHVPYFPKDSAVASVDEYLCTKEEVINRIRGQLQNAQNRMVISANKKRSDRNFEVNDYVYLKLQPYRQHSLSHRTSQKLAAKYYGPYLVIAKVGFVAYKLGLPTYSMIHLVFHVSQLKKHVGNHIVQSFLPIIDHSPVLQPRTILERRMVRRNH